VLVHGSLADHTTFDPLVAELRDAMTTFAMDRRGFGASGDAAGYAIWREFEDVAAVVDAVAGRTGRPVALWGHSYGAGCAIGGAARPATSTGWCCEPELDRLPPGSIGRSRRRWPRDRGPRWRCWGSSG
jgi:alpha-beta hydrolase superfamily lysophospholipase